MIVMFKAQLTRRFFFMLCLLLGAFGVHANQATKVTVEQQQYEVPVLTHKNHNPVLRLKITVPAGQRSLTLKSLVVELKGTTTIQDIAAIDVFYIGSDSVFNGQSVAGTTPFGTAKKIRTKTTIKGEKTLAPGDHFLWVCYTLRDDAAILGSVGSVCKRISFNDVTVAPSWKGKPIKQRIGVALRQHGQDGVHTSRIPGLATTNKGTLLAIFDARYESARDLQGHMDIGLHRSEDGGQTWEPLQVAMDMGEWGGLPQKFNGVSDACILVDKNSDAIYIAGLWMYGVLDADGKWVEGLTDTSTVWNHQWRNKGSQPGFGVKQTAQFLIVKSTDDGKTWGKPVNLTEQCKKEEWWLWAPAPGRGITLEDGTLVFPTQGRDASGSPFSNITYSRDGGKTWKTSNPALEVPGGTTECAVVQLADGALMLNMRANSNHGNTGDNNGRAIAITTDMGNTWQEHATSFRGLPEPTCMASLYVHKGDGVDSRFLLFLNPNSKTARDHITLKVSLDEGNSWPAQYWLLLDEWKGRGYSCITSVDSEYIGVLYESSQADMVFQKISIRELMQNSSGLPASSFRTNDW